MQEKRQRAFRQRAFRRRANVTTCTSSRLFNSSLNLHVRALVQWQTMASGEKHTTHTQCMQESVFVYILAYGGINWVFTEAETNTNTHTEKPTLMHIYSIDDL